MSKAKFAATNEQQGQQTSSSPSTGGSAGTSFVQGFVIGQLTLAVILLFFIRFFLFGDPPSPDARASARAALRKQRTLSHAETLRRRKSSHKALRHVSLGARAANALTPEEILAKTYYNVDRHQPESLDWVNVLIAQTIAQLRADALDDNALLSSLTKVLNGPMRPTFLTEIKITDISLGDEFPILSNCRVIPVDENGVPVETTTIPKGAPAARFGLDSSLQARMDVDLNDVLTLGIETKLVLNYPKPFVAVLPVALSVSVERFSGTLALSFIPSKTPPSSSTPTSPADDTARPHSPDGPPSIPTHSPTTLTFTFLDDYRLDLSVTSLVGSRSRLQDVPKIAQLVEQQLHTWFDERCVEPRFQQIVLPSLWPRKKNVRGGTDDQDSSALVDGDDGDPVGSRIDSAARPKARTTSSSFAAKARRVPGDLGIDEASITQAGAELRNAEERDRHRKRQTYQSLNT